VLPDNLHSVDSAPPTRFWQKISLVAEISHLCRKVSPDNPSYDRVLERIQQIIPFDAATLRLRRPSDSALCESACLGDKVNIPSVLITDSGTPGAIRLSEQPMLLSRRDDAAAEYGAMLYVPLIVDGVPLGALVLASIQKDVLTEQHLKLMSIVADQLAVSIERLNYVAAIEAKNQELRLAQQELRDNQKKVVAAEKLAEAARMAASVNHQINNPLAVILGHVQCLLLEQRDLGEKTLKRLNRIEQAAQRIASVNRDLLSIDGPSVDMMSDQNMVLSPLTRHPDEVGAGKP